MDPYPRGLVLGWLPAGSALLPSRPRAAGDGHFSLLNSLNPYKTFISGTDVVFHGADLSDLSDRRRGVVIFTDRVDLFRRRRDGLGHVRLVVVGVADFSLGLVGIYVGRTYKDVRGRPRYIVKDTIGFGD